MRIFSGLLHFSLPHSPYSHCTTQPKKIFLQFSWCSCAHRRRCRFTFDFFSPCFCSLAWCCCNHWAFYSSHSSPISSRRSQKKEFFFSPFVLAPCLQTRLLLLFSFSSFSRFYQAWLLLRLIVHSCLVASYSWCWIIFMWITSALNNMLFIEGEEFSFFSSAVSLFFIIARRYTMQLMIDCIRWY